MPNTAGKSVLYTRPPLPAGAWYVLITVNLKLRGVARIAPEPVMRRAFLDGGSDLHRKIVALALGLTQEEVTEEQRNGLGKPFNFGFIYGQGAESWRTGIRKDSAILLSAGQAEAFRRSFFKLYPGIAAWHARSELLAKDPANNSTRTPFGRLLLAQGESEWDRFALLVNYPVQGGTADVIKLAIVMIAGQLPLDVHLVIMAHDELVYDCPAELAEEVAQIVQTNMGVAFAQILGSEVPCEVDVQILSNWGGIDL
jgi:DNA polymerase-1